MPPRAFQKTKRGHGIRFAPASQAAVILSQGTQRPTKTADRPWRA
jgi:hypothetical protein